YFPAGLDVADVLARRPEAYHDEVRARASAGASEGAHTIHEAAAPKEAGLDALLAYDALRRGSLIEGLFAEGPTALDPVAPWAAAQGVIGDEWAAVEARLRWSPAAELGWGPVETVSLSEGGFERIYQGTALLLVWRLDVAPGEEGTLEAAVTLARR